MVLILASLSLLGNGSTYLGLNYVIAIVIAIIIAYFMGLYNSFMPELNPVTMFNKVSDKDLQISQAKVTRDPKDSGCSSIKEGQPDSEAIPVAEVVKDNDNSKYMNKKGGKKNKLKNFNIKLV
jgi:hypothetical protein